MNAVMAPDASECASSFVGTLLRRTRLAARLTADDLAAQIGVSETADGRVSSISRPLITWRG